MGGNGGSDETLIRMSTVETQVVVPSSCHVAFNVQHFSSRGQSIERALGWDVREPSQNQDRDVQVDDDHNQQSQPFQFQPTWGPNLKSSGTHATGRLSSRTKSSDELCSTSPAIPPWKITCGIERNSSSTLLLARPGLDELAIDALKPVEVEAS
jgi:hypothetical protein